MNEFDRMASRRNEAKEKKKRVILIGIVICIVLIIVLAFMIMYYQSVDAHTFKLYINDVQAQFTDGFYFTAEGNETYVRAKDIARYVEWDYQNGEYGTYTEDINSGYVQNEYEVASFVAGSNILKKYIEVTAQPTVDENKNVIQPFETNSVDGTLETTTLSSPIISQNGEIYFPLSGLNDICDCRVIYDLQNPYRMYIYSQNYLINLAQLKAGEFGYQEISGVYENMRLLPYGMMVVKKGSNFGVVGLYNNQSVIGFKYIDMVFAQNVKEFFVKTISGGEESIGIINIDGGQVVQPKNYSNIQILSDELGLYLVEKDNEYGVLNRQGDTIVHCEYDSIGIPEDILSTFQFSTQDNKYLLFNDTIVVKDDDKYGFYTVDGEMTKAVSYVGLGYIVSEDEEAIRNAEDVLTFTLKDLEISDGSTRDVRAIIVQAYNVDGEKRYGIYDAESQKAILPPIYNRIYSLTSRGNTEYYIEFEEDRVKVADLIAVHPEVFE